MCIAISSFSDNSNPCNWNKNNAVHLHRQDTKKCSFSDHQIKTILFTGKLARNGIVVLHSDDPIPPFRFRHMRGNGRSGGRGWCTDRLILPDKIKQRTRSIMCRTSSIMNTKKVTSFLTSVGCVETMDQIPSVLSLLF